MVLVQHPYAGQRLQGTRGRYQIVISNYRVVYELSPDTHDSRAAGDVSIVAVLGPGQD